MTEPQNIAEGFAIIGEMRDKGWLAMLSEFVPGYLPDGKTWTCHFTKHPDYLSGCAATPEAAIFKAATGVPYK